MSNVSMMQHSPASFKARHHHHGGGSSSTSGGGGGNPRGSVAGRGHSKNKTWFSGQGSHSASPSPLLAPAQLQLDDTSNGIGADGAGGGRWERGRGGSGFSRGRARGRRNGSSRDGRGTFTASANITEDEEEMESSISTPAPATNGDALESSTANGIKTWEELVKAREAERARAIHDGKMDDPLKPKRLDQAITIIGTCQDMCPEFERYRRERENNLDKWECIIGPNGKPTKKVDHARAVKIYERAQGDKIIPSDLRPARVLKRTLDYLFHDLIPRGGFADTQAFVRDRSRAVRGDFTIQKDIGQIAMDSLERCTRFHILSLHIMHGVSGFDNMLENQQLMNSLQSLKEAYDDQRGIYESQNELEMRIYHRLGLIRDQRERNNEPPPHIAVDPAYQLVTRFRTEVQMASIPITKNSPMKVSEAAMSIFAELAGVLRERRNIVMIYLIACFLEHIFGKDTIEDMESIKGSLTIQDVINGNSEPSSIATPSLHIIEPSEDGGDMPQEEMTEIDDAGEDDELDAFIEDIPEPQQQQEIPSPLKRGATQWLSDNFGTVPLTSKEPIFLDTQRSAFAPIAYVPKATESVFGEIAGSTSQSVFRGSAVSAFAPVSSPSGRNVFEGTIKTGQPKPTVVSNQMPIPVMVEDGKDKRPSSRSLADAPPLTSGNDDQVLSTVAPSTSQPAGLLAPQSAPALNPAAAPFIPRPVPQIIKKVSSESGPRATLPPLKTDSLLRDLSDQKQSSLLTPTGFATFPQLPSSVEKGEPPTPSIVLRTGQVRKAYAIDSPIGPPPLKRKAPISLPSTPTAAPTSTLPTEPIAADVPTPVSAFGAAKPPVTTSPKVTNEATEPIPLIFRALEQKPQPIPVVSSPLATKEPQVEDLCEDEETEYVPHPVVTTSKSERRRVVAMTFLRTHSLVRPFYFKWKQRAGDAVAWKEACRRSEEYKQKLHESASNISQSSSSSKRRREMGNSVDESGQARRRLRARVSQGATQVARTDDELVERLMQNRKENEKRWAKGSFIKSIRQYIQEKSDRPLENWATWLCMNPDNDSTAIWLEQKFDVPSSGTWESEAVFSVPASTNPLLETFPGLIVFELTPLEDIKDSIARKYHILDDCSRLRDVLTMLSPRRHYAPSILFVNWDVKPEDELPDDIQDLVANYVCDKTVRDVRTMPISSNSIDLDEAFKASLEQLDIDVEGELVERVTLSDIFKRLTSQWRSAAFIWAEASASDGSLNWALFSHVLQQFIKSLNAMMRSTLSAWGPGSSQLPLLPSLSLDGTRNEEIVSEALIQWLRSLEFASDYVTGHFSNIDFAEDFEPRGFFDQLLDIAVLYLGRYAPAPSARRAITKHALRLALKSFSEALEESQKQLRKASQRLPLSSSRRKSISTSPSYASDTRSYASTAPSPPHSTNMNGRQGGVISLVSDDDESTQEVISITSQSATTSRATSVAGDPSKPPVTIAMLRALSREVLRKYGGKRTAPF